MADIDRQIIRQRSSSSNADFEKQKMHLFVAGERICVPKAECSKMGQVCIQKNIDLNCESCKQFL